MDVVALFILVQVILTTAIGLPVAVAALLFIWIEVKELMKEKEEHDNTSIGVMLPPGSFQMGMPNMNPEPAPNKDTTVEVDGVKVAKQGYI